MNKVNDIDELEFKHLIDLTELKKNIEIEKILLKNINNTEKDDELNFIKQLCNIGYNPTRIKFMGMVEDVGIFLTLDYSESEMVEVNDKEIMKILENKDVVGIIDGYNNTTFVSADMFDKEYLKELMLRINTLKSEDKIKSYFSVENGEDVRVITREIVEKNILQAIKDKEMKEKEEEEERLKRENQEDKMRETKREDYENKGFYKEYEDGTDKNTGIVIEGNILKKENVSWRNYKLEFDSPLNSFLTFDEVKNLDDGEQNKLLSTFLSKKIGFNYSCSDKDICKITFDKDKVKINDIAVAKAKVYFILAKIRANPKEKERIDLYNKLSGMKVDVLELKELELYVDGINKGNKDDSNRLKIPIEINLLSEEMFKVSMFDKVVPMGWEKVKHFFFESNYGGKEKISRSPNNYIRLNRFQELTKEMAMEKPFIFEELNKIRLFGAI